LDHSLDEDALTPPHGPAGRAVLLAFSARLPSLPTIQRAEGTRFAYARTNPRWDTIQAYMPKRTTAVNRRSGLGVSFVAGAFADDKLLNILAVLARFACCSAQRLARRAA